MAITVKTNNDLGLAIIFAINKMMDSKEIKDKLEKPLITSVDTLVYGRPVSGLYERTYTLRNSIASQTRNEGLKVRGFVGFDPSLMIYTYPSINPNSERGNLDNRPNAFNTDVKMNNIVHWLDGGHGGLWNYEETNMLEVAQIILESEFERIIKGGLSSRGFKVF